MGNDSSSFVLLSQGNLSHPAATNVHLEPVYFWVLKHQTYPVLCRKANEGGFLQRDIPVLQVLFCQKYISISLMPQFLLLWWLYILFLCRSWPAVDQLCCGFCRFPPLHCGRQSVAVVRAWVWFCSLGKLESSCHGMLHQHYSPMECLREM